MTTWRIYNTIDGTDLGEYEASSRADALRMFLADTDDVTLAPGVMAEQVQGNRTGTGAVSASNQLWVIRVERDAATPDTDIRRRRPPRVGRLRPTMK